MAREQGLSLAGPDGLLKQLTKTVIETALGKEMTEHWTTRSPTVSLCAGPRTGISTWVVAPLALAKAWGRPVGRGGRRPGRRTGSALDCLMWRGRLESGLVATSLDRLHDKGLDEWMKIFLSVDDIGAEPFRTPAEATRHPQVVHSARPNS